MSDRATNSQEASDLNDEIDLKNLTSFVLRNKKFISIFTIISVFFGLIDAYTSKKIWKGEFQIVLEKKEGNNRNNSMILEKLDLPFNLNPSSSGGNLMTQVAILESPLVLENVFEFVKKKNSLINGGKKSNLEFKSWKNNSLEIGLEKGTAVLNIAYRNKDKDLIVPVLKKISESYQDYSGRQRLRSIELGKNFFEEQISIFSKKSQDSLRAAQNYGMMQDLTILQGEANIDAEIPNAINIEAIRINNRNIIRNIDIQLKQLDEIDDSEKIMYIGMSIPELVNQGLPQKLDSIDRELLDINDQLKQINQLENNSSEGLMILFRSIPSLVASGLPDRLDNIDNKIISLKSLREEINDLGDNALNVQYYGDSIPQLVQSGLTQKLKDIETELAFKSYVYKENDETIIKIKKERKILIEVLKEQALGYLNADLLETERSRPKVIEKLKKRATDALIARRFILNNSKPRLISLLKDKAINFLQGQKTNAISQLKAAERPEGVIFKYKELIRTARKDKLTLDNLETQYRSLLLKEAQIEDPWELITSPSVLNLPVAPSKKKIVILYFIFGLFISSLIIFIYEKRKNIVFDFSYINKLGFKNLKFNCELFLNQESSIKDNLFLLSQYGFLKSSMNIGLLIIGDIDKKDILQLKNKLNNDLPKNKIYTLKRYTELIEFKKLIIVTAAGITRKDDMEKFKKLIPSNPDLLLANIFIKDLQKNISTDKRIEMFIIYSVKNYRILRNSILNLNFVKLYGRFAKKLSIYYDLIVSNLKKDSEEI